MKTNRAGQHRTKKASQPRGSIHSWIGFILLLPFFALLLGIFLNTEGGFSGDFTRYIGPVLPMTSLNGAEGVEVTRDVNFDFSPYQGGKSYIHTSVGGAGITDTYTLTNATDEPKQLELVYSFQGSFIDQPEEFPTITADGQPVQPQLYPSVDLEEKVFYTSNFGALKKELAKTDYMGIALSQPEELNIPVTAYHFTDLAYNGEKLAPYPMLTLEFSLDENTGLWLMSYATATTTEEGKHFMMFRVDEGEAWLFTVGGTLKDLKTGGNIDYNVGKDSATDGVTYKLETFETTLQDAIRSLAERYDYWAIPGREYDPNSGRVTPDILLDGVIKRYIADEKPGSSDFYSIHLLFDEVITERRMMYLVFPVTLDPGQSMTVEASYVQEPSSDNGGPKEDREGFDLATRLGSDLHFTGLSASLTNTDPIILSEQNFGFDLEQGITEVELDLQVEQYYLELKLKK